MNLVSLSGSIKTKIQSNRMSNKSTTNLHLVSYLKRYGIYNVYDVSNCLFGVVFSIYPSEDYCFLLLFVVEALVYIFWMIGLTIYLQNSIGKRIFFRFLVFFLLLFVSILCCWFLFCCTYGNIFDYCHSSVDLNLIADFRSFISLILISNFIGPSVSVIDRTLTSKPY